MMITLWQVVCNAKVDTGPGFSHLCLLWVLKEAVNHWGIVNQRYA